jgi:hypothetical protein
MKHFKKNLATINRNGPAKALLLKLGRIRRQSRSTQDNRPLSDAYRDILRTYLALVSSGATPAVPWRRVVREALGFLGGQADRHTSSLAEYDHRRYGPYLGVSDEGSAAHAIRMAAFATPKAQALGRKASPLTVGVGLDAERLGSIGEVPVGPDEYADIWSDCVGRLAMTTNVGSRANLRFYKRAPLVTIPTGPDALETAKAGLAAEFKPFLEAPGEPRSVVVFVEFEAGRKPPFAAQRATLRSLVDYVRISGIAAPDIHQIGLSVRIGWGSKGRDSAIQAVDLARAAEINHVSIDGVVRKEGDQLISLPGLLNYLPPDLVAEVLVHAQSKQAKGIQQVNVNPINAVDPGTVAREIWTGLNAARAMGLDLGKYGLAPLTLEECDAIVGRVQRWFPDWCAAPVFYVDQGIISQKRVYVGDQTAEGIEAWLHVVAEHKVRIVLIDTVEKSKGWRILKTNNDPKGILLPKQIARLKSLGEKLGIKMLWAGGITLDHAYQFGKLGVFGLYVTSAASKAARVSEEYWDDPGLSAEKEPTFAGVLQFKTALEGGFLLEHLVKLPKIQAEIKTAGVDPKALSRILPRAWRAWWKQ